MICQHLTIMSFTLKMLNVAKTHFFGNREKLKHHFSSAETSTNPIGYKFPKHFPVILYYDLFVDIFPVLITTPGFALPKRICFVCCTLSLD